MTKQHLIHALEPSPGILSKILKLGLPEAYMDKIASFVSRNTFLKIIKNNSPVENVCCPQCLKAHLKKTAIELELDKQLVKKISALTGGNAGHQGYYMDNEQLIKMN